MECDEDELTAKWIQLSSRSRRKSKLDNYDTVEWLSSKPIFVWNSTKVFETELNTVLRTEDNHDKLYMPKSYTEQLNPTCIVCNQVWMEYKGSLQWFDYL